MGDGTVQDPGNRLGRERGSFLSAQVFFYGPGLNFDSSEMTYIDIHQRIKENGEKHTNLARRSRIGVLVVGFSQTRALKIHALLVF